MSFEGLSGTLPASEAVMTGKKAQNVRLRSIPLKQSKKDDCFIWREGVVNKM